MKKITKGQVVIATAASMAIFAAGKAAIDKTPEAGIQGATQAAIGSLCMTIISKKLGMIEE